MIFAGENEKGACKATIRKWRGMIQTPSPSKVMPASGAKIIDYFDMCTVFDLFPKITLFSEWNIVQYSCQADS